MATIILDAGHGGNDLGDAYGNRYEKNDNLILTMAVGKVLKEYGYEVIYIRTNDIYVSINDRVRIANRYGANLILSIHRIIGELIISEAGLGFYVDKLGGVAEMAAINIAKELGPLGFVNYSIEVRSEHLLIRDTDAPALMMGIGYLNSDYDNLVFDTRLEDIALAIARGVADTIPLNNNQNEQRKSISSEENRPSNVLYTVQVGLFADNSEAVRLHNELLNRSYPSQITFLEPFYSVMVGASEDLDLIAELEYCLRLDGFSTIVIIM